jgi:hypothetical protein
MSEKNYPTIRESKKWEIASGALLISRWCRVFRAHLPDDPDESHILSAKCRADQGIGIRSIAMEMIFSDFMTRERTVEFIVSTARIIASAGESYRLLGTVAKCLDLLDHEVPGLSQYMSWCVPTSIDEPFNCYKFVNYPAVDLIRASEAAELGSLMASPLSLKEGLARCKTRSQRDALRRIVSITKAVERFEGKLGDVTLNKAALMVAPSGSGKTWLAKLAGRVLGLPVHCYTVSGWSPRDSYSRHDSIMTAIKQIEAAENGCMIFLDEICKIQNDGMGSSGNYWRTCQTEIMQLVTGDVSDYPTTPQFRKNFGKCWFVFAGAFQNLYRAQIGTALPTAEEVEGIDITLDDVIASHSLPDELINRTGFFVHLSPPGIADMRSAMIQVEKAADIIIDEKEREGYAEEIVSRMQGFRGLETYALRVAQKAVLMEKKASSESSKEGGEGRLRLPTDFN